MSLVNRLCVLGRFFESDAARCLICVVTSVFLMACGVEGVVTLDGDGLEAVLVTTDATPEVEATSNNNGSYFLLTPERGLLTVRPTLHGFDFDPRSRRVLNFNREGLVRGVNFEAQLHEFSNEEILEIFQSDYVVPETFYFEETGERIVNVTSLDLISIDHIRIGAWDSPEVCSDDPAQIWEWLDESEGWSAGWEQGELIETGRYFEVPVRFDEESDWVRMRFLKCSYFDASIYDSEAYWRSEWDPEIGEVPRGVLGKRPINKRSVRNLVEYLWFVDHAGEFQYHPPGSFGMKYKILRSHGVDTGDSIEHELLEIHEELLLHTMDASYPYCGPSSMITVKTLHYSVDKETGEIWVSQQRDRRVVVHALYPPGSTCYVPFLCPLSLALP